MSWTVSFLTENDIPSFGDIDAAATADWGLAHAMAACAPAGSSRRQTIENWVRSGLAHDSRQVWLKAVDTASGEMAAAALWRFQLDVQDSTPTQPPPGETDGEKKQSVEDRPSVMAALQESWEEFKSQHFAAVPYMNLAILITHPRFQRRGAGSALVQWGCDEADKRNVISVLQASAVGYRMYERHGFEIVSTRELDLRPWGVEDTELRRNMVRQP